MDQRGRRKLGLAGPGHSLTAYGLAARIPEAIVMLFHARAGNLVALWLVYLDNSQRV